MMLNEVMINRGPPRASVDKVVEGDDVNEVMITCYRA